MSTLAYELRLLGRERSVWILLFLWCAALIYALATGWHVAANLRSALTAFEASAFKEFTELRANTEAAERAGTPVGKALGYRASTPAVLRPRSLAFLAVGESDLQPHSMLISLFGSERSFGKGYELQSPVTLALGRFDLSFAVVVLMPLLLIALSYEQLAQDRERHRLQLLATQGDIQSLLWRRLLLRGALVCAPLALITGVAALLAGGIAAVPAWLAWLAAALTWALFWLALCAVTGARARASGSAATLLIACWLALVLLLPAALSVLIQQLAPSPSPLITTMAIRQVEVQADRQRERIIGRYVSDHPELERSAMEDELARSRRYVIQQLYIAAALVPASLGAQQQQLRQRRIQRALYWLSPAQLLEQAFSNSAGTDSLRFEAFKEQARMFEKAWDATLTASLMQGKTLDSQALASLPRFEFVQTRSWSSVWVAAWLAMLAAVIVLVNRLRTRPQNFYPH